MRGATHPGYVEPDHLDPGVDLVDERLQQVEAGADAVAEHKWRAGTGARPDRHPDVVPEHPDPAELAHWSNT